MTRRFCCPSAALRDHGYAGAGGCDDCRPRVHRPEHLDLLVELDPGEAMFPSVYQPARMPWTDTDSFQVTFPAHRLLGERTVRLLGLGPDDFRVREVRPWSGDLETVSARSKARPEVGVILSGSRMDCASAYSAGVNYLADLGRQADARNISRDRLLAEHALTIQLRGTRGDLLPVRYRGSVGDKYVLALEKVYLKDPF